MRIRDRDLKSLAKHADAFGRRFELEIPRPLKPLPGQMELFPERREPYRSFADQLLIGNQRCLFDTGADLPGGRGNRTQKLLWDV